MGRSGDGGKWSRGWRGSAVAGGQGREARRHGCFWFQTGREAGKQAAGNLAIRLPTIEKGTAATPRPTRLAAHRRLAGASDAHVGAHGGRLASDGGLLHHWHSNGGRCGLWEAEGACHVGAA